MVYVPEEEQSIESVPEEAQMLDLLDEDNSPSQTLLKNISEHSLIHFVSYILCWYQNQTDTARENYRKIPFMNID